MIVIVIPASLAAVAVSSGIRLKATTWRAIVFLHTTGGSVRTVGINFFQLSRDK